MNIGKWIIVVFVLFALFIGTLVTVCVRQDISLVSKDYYREELAYQEQISRIRNTRELKEKPKISRAGAALELSFAQPVGEGRFKLFCPSNKDMDRNFEIDPSVSINSFFISDLQKGMYRAKISWTMDGREYYYEEVIYI